MYPVVNRLREGTLKRENMLDGMHQQEEDGSVNV
jgi:hypothetical protein